ncbi:helix-turn-helix transcriptional regulator [Shewanella nanhaiensis]|uniref:DNA-binding response regulator n=1 Tax=Shewanella nanhaiensis TaxID=2864872 RepID=A0ABS7E9E6_9GAMM|nr:DNA-binding response regulator [Shewanella nanhaiensis]MBW8186323.1 DNA-binding response regulator [Shewanella nanhaiensis]
MNKNSQAVFSILRAISTTFHRVGITTPPILAIEDIASTEKQRLFSSGIRDYISFPIIKEELLYRIRNALHHVESVTDARKHKVSENEILAIRTAEYLKSQIANEISLKSLTKEIGTNRNKLSSAFNQTYGMTVFSWIRQQRMQYAAKLLKNTSLTILQVSESVGYPDSNNFSTAFRRAFNQSPREYRANTSIDASSKETHA